MKLFVLVGALLVGVCFSAPLYAGEAPPPASYADAAYRQARAHFQAGRFDDAILEFNKAYRADPNPVLLFNIARCFEEKKDYRVAIEYYQRYLEKAPNADDAPAVKEALRTLQVLASADTQGRLSVRSTPEGAKVLVDGRLLGETPVDLPMEPGARLVVVEKDGFGRASQSVQVEGGQSATVTLTLVPISAEGPVAKQDQTTAWILVGVGGALLVGASITGAMALSKSSELDDIDDGKKTATASEYDNLQSDGRTLAYTTDGLILSGLAGVVTGVVLLMTEEEAPQVKPAAGVPSLSWSL